MNPSMLQAAGAGQTLALLCFGLGIVALLWVFRRNLRLEYARKSGKLEAPPSIAEMRVRLDSAHRHITTVEQKERKKRLERSVSIERVQVEPDTDQAALLEQITRQQRARTLPRELR